VTRAMILAAGEGTRLRPLTATIPKPMLPLADRPLLAHLFDLLLQHGVREVAINLHHLPHVIPAYFGNGRRFGVRIIYSYEEKLLGSAGAIKKLGYFFDETFLVLYGDVLTDLDLTALQAFHSARGAAVTMALHQPPDLTRCGVAEIDPQGRVRRFREKPPPGEVCSPWANAGIYVMEPAVQQFIPAGQPFDFAADLFPLLLERGLPVYGCPSDAYVLDIGSAERYRQAERHLAQRGTLATAPGG
jgi:NDP-sugar pyrophosphorylase family protein